MLYVHVTVYLLCMYMWRQCIVSLLMSYYLPYLPKYFLYVVKCYIAQVFDLQCTCIGTCSNVICIDVIAV